MFFTALLSIVGVKSVTNFFSKYEILIFDKEDLLEDEEQAAPFDLRGTPTHECLCGSNQFYVRASFENYELAQYFLDMQCVSCGSLATAPTPVDKEASE